MFFSFPPLQITDISLQWKDKRSFTEIEVPLLIDHIYSTNSKNRIILGDNKSSLASLLPEFQQRIQLIYLDPPFASEATYFGSLMIGKKRIKFPQYNDHWERNQYLQFLYERLILLHALLHKNGLLILHLDENIVHESKLILDEIFGVTNFRSEIIWELGTGAKSRKMYSIQHNTLLIYSKSKDWYFHANTPENRIPFSDTSIKTHFKNIDEKGRRYRKRHVNGKDYIYYADEGKMVGSVWTDISSMLGTSPIMKESTGYPTQKPQKLLERLIASCSQEGEFVLDPFMGSGSTLRAAHKCNRHFIGLDKNAGSFQTVVKTFIDTNCYDFHSQFSETPSSTIQAEYTIKNNCVDIQITYSPILDLLDTQTKVQDWLSFVIVRYQNKNKTEHFFDSDCTLQYEMEESWSQVHIELWDKMGNFCRLQITELQ